jgi:hypothetical protein
VLEVEREDAPTPRALRAVPGTSLDDLDLERVNDYIQHLNWPVRVETLKSDLESARPFLERRGLLRDGEVTQLGLLLASPHPEAYLGARSAVRLETPGSTETYQGSLIPVLEESLTALLRSVRAEAARVASATLLPDEVLRQAVQNSVAHRDYAVNRPLVVRTGASGRVTLAHPGRFPAALLVQSADPDLPLRGLLPLVEPANPWLTDLLHVYRKWDGRQVGVTTLLRACLEEQLDLPYYRLEGGEVRLTLRPGSPLDAAMEARLQSCDAYLEYANRGEALSRSQQRALAYLMKAEWAHRQGAYTLLLTGGTPAEADLSYLARLGLIVPHPAGTPERPLYVAHRLLMRRDFSAELEQRLGPVFHELNAANQALLMEAYRQEAFSRWKACTPARAALCLWAERTAGAAEAEPLEPFQEHVRAGLGRLRRAGFLVRTRRGYVVNADYGQGRLF